MTSQNPTKRSIWKILLKLFLGFAVLFAVHDITLRWAEPELAAKKVRIRALRAEVKALGQRVESSRVRQKMAERQVEVLRQANNLLREEESSRQTDMQRLQGEVAFYQRLSGTSGSQEGLAVYNLEIQPTSSEQVFRFVLTLTQNLRRSAIIGGTVSMALEGIRGDKPATLKWKEITEEGSAKPEFRFKYFQQLDGYLAVPADFQPTRVRVTLAAKGSSKPLSREFDWSELMGVETAVNETPAMDAEIDSSLNSNVSEKSSESSPPVKNDSESEPN